MDLAHLQQLIQVCRAGGVTHLNTPEIELRFTLEAGQTIAPAVGALGALGEVPQEDEKNEDGDGDGDGDEESDESLIAQLARANFDPGNQRKRPA